MWQRSSNSTGRRLVESGQARARVREREGLRARVEREEKRDSVRLGDAVAPWYLRWFGRFGWYRRRIGPGQQRTGTSSGRDKDEEQVILAQADAQARRGFWTMRWGRGPRPLQVGVYSWSRAKIWALWWWLSVQCCQRPRASGFPAHWTGRLGDSGGRGEQGGEGGPESLESGQGAIQSLGSTASTSRYSSQHRAALKSFFFPLLFCLFFFF